MNPLDLTIENCLWFGKNFAYNLDFVPEDKLHWKPVETSKSAAEITTEVLGVFGFVRGLFNPTDAQPEGYANIKTRDEAKAKLLETTRSYAEFLRGLKPEDLEGTYDTPFGPFPKKRLAILPVQEISHHHGQITYLQTMWGDKDSHLHEMDPDYKEG
ncbi:MAG: DinB family protein [Proteobacteria bacterium]|nr:MAG: DinB family protein [Pseudomonadota bacterium]